MVALNSDGQSSLYVEQTPPTFTYDPAPAPSLVVSPSVLTPGSSITVSVTGTNTNFIDPNANPVTGSLVGFGTSDVVVQQVTVQSPTQLTVVVTPNVPVYSNMISVTTGLGIISQALGLSGGRHRSAAVLELDSARDVMSVQPGACVCYGNGPPWLVPMRQRQNRGRASHCIGTVDR